MNRTIAVLMIALPLGAIALPRVSTAAEILPQPNQSEVIAQRFDPNYPSDRRSEIQREEARRAEIRREEVRRDSERRVWIPGHWEPGFLGIGRKWVAGHWETR